MDPLRRLARPMLAAIFVTSGLDSLRSPEGPSQVAGDVATDLADTVNDATPVSLPDDPVQLVRIDAAVKVAGGLLLASGGRLARLGALACAASLVPTTLAAHRFWEVEDADDRTAQQIHFMKNVGLLGGLLLAATDTGGRPSVPWRAGHAAHDLADRAGDLLPG